MQDHDDRWLDGLKGQNGEGQAHEEGLALREALKEPLPASNPMLSWSELKAVAGLASVTAPSAAPMVWLQTVGGLLVGNRMAVAAVTAALGAALVLTTTPWPRETTNPAPPTLRGAAPQSGETIWPSDDPNGSASKWLQRWRNEGLAVSREELGSCVELKMAVKPGQEAVLLAAELVPDAEGIARVRFCPKQ
jgi:hypothetical protein